MSPSFFFFNDPATTEIYTLSLHDALPISAAHADDAAVVLDDAGHVGVHAQRSEEHTSELQSHSDLVCRLLLEKKKNNPQKSSSCHEPRRSRKSCRWSRYDKFIRTTR